jgi:hypothetical protein
MLYLTSNDKIAGAISNGHRVMTDSQAGHEVFPARPVAPVPVPASKKSCRQRSSKIWSSGPSSLQGEPITPVPIPAKTIASVAVLRQWTLLDSRCGGYGQMCKALCMMLRKATVPPRWCRNTGRKLSPSVIPHRYAHLDGLENASNDAFNAIALIRKNSRATPGLPHRGASQGGCESQCENIGFVDSRVTHELLEPNCWISSRSTLKCCVQRKHRSPFDLYCRSSTACSVTWLQWTPSWRLAE